MINFDDKVCVLQLLGHKVWIVLKVNLGHLLKVRGIFRGKYNYKNSRRKLLQIEQYWNWLRFVNKQLQNVKNLKAKPEASLLWMNTIQSPSFTHEGWQGTILETLFCLPTSICSVVRGPANISSLSHILLLLVCRLTARTTFFEYNVLQEV